MTNDSGIGAFFNTFIFICTTLSSTVCITVGSKSLLSQMFSSTGKYGCLWWPTFLPFGHVIFCKWDLGIYSRRQIFWMTNDLGIGVLFNAFIFICTTLSSTVCSTVQWVQSGKWLLIIDHLLKFSFHHWLSDKLGNIKASNLESCQSIQVFLKKVIKMERWFSSWREEAIEKIFSKRKICISI